MKKIFLFFAFAVLLAVTPLYAQLLGFSHSVSLIGIAPTGAFAKDVRINNLEKPIFDRSQIAKDATIGVGLSYRIGKRFDVIIGDLTPFAEVGFFWNRISGDNRDAFDDKRSDDPRYRNMPMMLGVQYRHDLLPLIKPYIEVGLGIDWFLPVKEGWEDKSGYPYYVFKSSTATAWQLGVGTYIGGLVSVGITYYALGKHAFDFNTNRTEMRGFESMSASAQNDSKAEYRRINALAMKVSFHF